MTFKLSRRAALGFGVAAILQPTMSFAQSNGPIRVLVGFSAGGGVDTSLRKFADRMGAHLGGDLAIDNKVGANGAIAAQTLATSVPDGKTVMYTAGSAVAVAPHLAPVATFDPINDITPINKIGATPFIIVTRKDLGVSTLAELADMVKKQNVSFASSGIGSLSHLIIEQFREATGGDISHLPYAGGGPGLVDVLAGHVDAIAIDVTPVMQHIRDGSIIPIAVTTNERVPQLPDVPTAAELLPGFVVASWMGFWGPKGMSPETAEKISQAMQAALAEPEITEALTQIGVVVEPNASPQEFAAFVASEHKRWGEFITANGIKA